MINFNRKFAQPNQWTFSSPPIAELVRRYVGNGAGWIDPFAGRFSPAEFTNDLNPAMPAQSHMDALEWARTLTTGYQGVLFDPPYSFRQIKECYEGIGRKVRQQDTQTSFYSKVKDAIAPKIKIGGIAICCGWSSVGFSRQRGFEMLEILLVYHGGQRNDTIVTVERKVGGETETIHEASEIPLRELRPHVLAAC